MAKPIGNGKSMEMNGKSNAALDRSWLVAWDESEGFAAINRGGEGVPNVNDGTEDFPFLGSKSNDFFYIDPSLGSSGEGDETPIYGNLTIEGEDEGTLLGPVEPLSPYIDGLGGADQIIMMEEAIIGDTFFINMDNVTVLKLWDGNDAADDYEFTGSQVTLAEQAQEAEIREVTGGPGGDVIDFSGYEIQYETDEEDIQIPISLDIIIRGGAGADEMTASEGNDTFIWKAGDMEGTNTTHDDWEEGDSPGNYIFDKIIDFNGAGTDVLDISDLLIGFNNFGEATNPEEQLVYLLDWVEFKDSILYVDIDGEGSSYESEALVELQGVTDLNLLSDLIVC